MKQAVSSGERLANARDKTSIYAFSQSEDLSPKEREEMQKILKERFQPGARPMPNSIAGLASLANERIENAIARGQFKNIPRGKGVNKEVDYNANSPFIDTTAYFMNKMIQRQDIVPPWIEKQQEVVKTATTFRSRLRNDWKRHAARVIASKGGPLEAIVRRAEAYARAEAAFNPKTQKIEALSQIDGAGKPSQVNVVETPSNKMGDESVDIKITVVETPLGGENAVAAAAAHVSVPAEEAPANMAGEGHEVPQLPATHPLPDPPPFRDPAWESLELSYHRAALKQLNSLTRSYNLMAPELAKKPYFSLHRELASCFADVAPQLPAAIRERARRPERIRVEIVGHRPGGVLEKFGGEHAKVYDSTKPAYGLKEFWRELWKKGGERIA